MTPRRVFVTGGTGYLGRLLIPELIRAGVGALVRPGSESRVPNDCERVLGKVLDAPYVETIPPFGTFEHLVGVPHPNPDSASQC
jgi:nucleoside-diphosphate-sugar epimerase